MASVTPGTLLLLALALLVVAFLYSSVGHAGASGYLAVMALAGLAPDFIRPTVLLLNVLVACLSTWHFYRAGHFSWRLFWPFALLSVPCAFLGGWLHLPTRVFCIMLGVVLLGAAVRFLLPAREEAEPHEPPRAAALGLGAALGLVSGLIGIGGGVLLTPLLILRRWARTKTAAAVSAVFILLNSLAGLAGLFTARQAPPELAWPLALPLHFVCPLCLAVLVGGAAGSYLGSHRFSVPLVKRLLAAVLVLAAAKLILT